MKAIDSSFLTLLLVPGAPVSNDPATNKPTERAHDRVEELIRSLNEGGEKILVPTPALSELLVIAGEAGPQYLAELNTSSVFRIVDFDQRAAVEAAATTAKAIADGDKRGGSGATWTKIKFDRQIVAIAKVNGADTIYSTDRDIERFGEQAKLAVVNVHQLPPPPAKQIEMYDEQPEAQQADPSATELQRSGDGPSQGQATTEAEAGEGGKEEAPN